MKQIKIPTLMGFLAVIFWSTSIAFSRSMAEKMGTLNMAFFNLLISGSFLLLVQSLIYKKKLLGKIVKLPFGYYVKVGSFMIVYMVFFYTAVGQASTREAVIIIGIINYLWPGLTFLFSVPILKNRAKYMMLISGILVAFTGTILAILEGHQVSLDHLKFALKGDWLPFLYALIAAVSWAIYSNMTRRFQQNEDRAALPLLLLVAGIVILGIMLINGITPGFNLSGYQWLELAYLAVFPTALAYLFWDRAMKHGNKNLVVAFSYITPLASTLISGIYLQVPIRIGFGFAAVLVITGAILCRQSIQDGPLVS